MVLQLNMGVDKQAPSFEFIPNMLVMFVFDVYNTQAN